MDGDPHIDVLGVIIIIIIIIIIVVVA